MSQNTNNLPSGHIGPPKSPRRYTIEILSGADKGLVRNFEERVIRFGTKQANTVQLSDLDVSEVHCEISMDDEDGGGSFSKGLLLRDLHSKNGTFVGPHRIVEIYIERTTEVRVGNTRFRISPNPHPAEAADSGLWSGMIGQSDEMQRLFARMAQIAPSDIPVLICGETGVGKSLVATAMHQLSDRNTGPLVVLDCSAVANLCIDSELFGHERGAFPGATQRYIGTFERAHGGVLCIDKVAELPISGQAKLLRFLQNRQLRRIGGNQTIGVDARIVVTTNRDLAVEVNRGRFREDLYYRLAGTRICVPPLRRRASDIPLLIAHIWTSLPQSHKQPLSPEILCDMQAHDWPGNVRELRNVVRGTALFADPVLAHKRTIHLSKGPTTGEIPAKNNLLSMEVDTGTPYKALKQKLVIQFERLYITQLLKEHNQNISSAARSAGIDRMSIHKILNRLRHNSNPTDK